MEFYLPVRKKETVTFARKGLKLDITMVRETNQIQKDKCHVLSHIYRI